MAPVNACQEVYYFRAVLAPQGTASIIIQGLTYNNGQECTLQKYSTQQQQMPFE